MKRFFIVLFISCFLMPAPALAENSFYVEEVNHITSDDIRLGLRFFAPLKLTDHFGVYSWVSIDRAWAESIAGFSISVSPKIEFGVGGGVEKAEGLWRINGYAWMGNDTGYLSGMWEYGASGFLYRLEGNHQLLSWLGAGFLAQRGIGFGPRLQLNVPKTHVVMYAAPVYDIETKQVGGFIGFRFGP